LDFLQEVNPHGIKVRDGALGIGQGTPPALEDRRVFRKAATIPFL
jgi:hypothetical protein